MDDFQPPTWCHKSADLGRDANHHLFQNSTNLFQHTKLKMFTLHYITVLASETEQGMESGTMEVKKEVVFLIHSWNWEKTTTENKKGS